MRRLKEKREYDKGTTDSCKTNLVVMVNWPRMSIYNTRLSHGQSCDVKHALILQSLFRLPEPVACLLRNHGFICRTYRRDPDLHGRVMGSLETSINIRDILYFILVG